MEKVLTHSAPHQRTRGGHGGIDAVIRESAADFSKLRLIYIKFAHASCTGTDPVLAGNCLK